MKKVYFIRHGETEANVEGYYQSPEVPLSAKGHEGAKAVAERCTHLDIDVVFASPFVRAQETAQHIADAIQKPLIIREHAHEALNPAYIFGTPFASEEGRTYKKERKENFLNEQWGPDGAENYFSVAERIAKTIAVLETSEYENIILVSHGNFLRYLTIRLLLEKNDDATHNIAGYESLNVMSNVGISEFTYDKDRWKLVTWNDHAHFAE